MSHYISRVLLVVFLLSSVFTSWIPGAFSQDIDLVSSVIKSTSWESKVQSHELGLVVRKQSASDRDDGKGKLSSSHFESILKVRSISSAKDSAFAVVASYGLTNFKMEPTRSDPKLYNLANTEDESESSFVIGSPNGINRLDLEGRPKGLPKTKVRKDAFGMIKQLALRVKLELYPLVFDHEQEGEETSLEQVVNRQSCYFGWWS